MNIIPDEDGVINENFDANEILESVKIDVDEELTPIEKTKSVVTVKEKNPIFEDEQLTNELYSEFSSFLEKKADIVKPTDDITKPTVATGIDILDAILGGGFAIGALNMIIGTPGSGKTMLAIQTMGQAQRQFKGKLISGFLDSEESTTQQRLANLGVRYPKITPYADMTVEKVFKFLEGLCVFKQQKNIIDIPSVVIWDSIANTLSQKEREAEDPNAVIGYKARLLSLLIPKYVAKASQNNICWIAINQLRDQISMGGPYQQVAKDLKFMSQGKTTPGGNTIKFNAFQLIEMKAGTALSSEKGYGFDGITSKLKCVKNKLFTPNIEIEIVGSFNYGFSNFWTNYKFLVDNKRLNSGAWNYLVSMPEKKFRTKDALKLYEDEPDFKTAYDKEVKDTIKTEILDKYSIADTIE